MGSHVWNYSYSHWGTNSEFKKMWDAWGLKWPVYWFKVHSSLAWLGPKPRTSTKQLVGHRVEPETENRKLGPAIDWPYTEILSVVWSHWIISSFVAGWSWKKQIALINIETKHENENTFLWKTEENENSSSTDIGLQRESPKMGRNDSNRRLIHYKNDNPD